MQNLTDSGRDHHNDGYVSRLLRRNIRSLASALMLTFAIGVSAQCVSASQMTAAQQACCAAMGHDCGTAAKEQGCCSSEAPRVDVVSAAKRMTISAPYAAVTQVAATEIARPLLVITRAGWFDHAAPSPPGVPTYILISTFRI